MRFFGDGPTFVRKINLPQLALVAFRDDADVLFGVLDDADVLFGALDNADVLFGALDNTDVLVMQARYVSGRHIWSDDRSCHLLTVICSLLG